MEKRKTSSMLSGKIGVAFLVAGILAIVFSIYSESQILMFAGLGLTFWGALFLLITPQRQFEGFILETSTVPQYMTIDRMVKDLSLKDEAFCIPSFPKSNLLPEHLKGLEETVMFIPEKNSQGIASLEELAKGKFQIENPKGILIIPPGISILNRIEQKLSTDLTKTPKEEFIEMFIPLLQKLNLTKDAEIVINGDEATLKIMDSAYKNLYGKKYNLRSINFLGCPTVNAVACAIAKYTGKPVAVQSIQNSSFGQSITASFKILQS